MIDSVEFDTILKDIYKVYPIRYVDNRGVFFEMSKDITDNIKQRNCSISKKGTFRGLHYQLLHPQHKVITVLSGSIIDVVLDIRKNSPTFGTARSFVLSSMLEPRTDLLFKPFQLVVPIGFAHGFYVLEDNTIVSYVCGEVYYPEDEYGVYIFDGIIQNQLGLLCNEFENATMSHRDHRWPNLYDIPDKNLFMK
jgi:dTDP-4-dehydrorhamnose 3,5-epimerase